MSWNMFGHEWAVEMLAGQLAAGRLRHAYLLAGPQGVGRRTLALRLAQAVNCPEPPAPGEACGTCWACRQIAAQQHPDLAVVSAEAAGGTLRVDQVRELQHFLSLAPYAAAYRVALLLRFEEAHIGAANALLKTLEEPPARVVLVLTADSPESVPETILSRCQVLRLRPLPAGQLAAAMHGAWGLPEQDAVLLAHLSGGRPGVAHLLHEQPEVLERRSAWLDDHERLLASGRAERFNYAEQAARDRQELRSMLEIWAAYWRDVMIAGAGSAAPLTNVDRLAQIRAAAGRVSPPAAQRVLVEIETTRDRIDRYANLRLVMETLMLSLPRFSGPPA